MFIISLLTFYFLMQASKFLLFFMFHRLKPIQKQLLCLFATMVSIFGEIHGSMPRLRCVLLVISYAKFPTQPPTMPLPPKETPSIPSRLGLKKFVLHSPYDCPNITSNNPAACESKWHL